MIYMDNSMAKAINARICNILNITELSPKQEKKIKTLNDIDKMSRISVFSKYESDGASGAWHALNYAHHHKNVTVVEYSEDGDVIVFAMTPNELKKFIKSIPKSKD